MDEMQLLSGIAGAENMKGLKVVITHMKPPAKQYEIIKRQLIQQNALKLNLIFPEQGRAFGL